MIAAYLLNDYNDAGLGSWRFDALPRLGDHIVLQTDGAKTRYEVACVEHWPTVNDGSPTDPAHLDNVFVRVRWMADLPVSLQGT